MSAEESTPLLGHANGGSSRCSGVTTSMEDSVLTESYGKYAPGHDRATEVSSEFHSAHSDPLRLDESDFVTVTENQDLKRGLHQRHVSLIAIAGAIVRGDSLLRYFND
jgi:amino acid permease